MNTTVNIFLGNNDLVGVGDQIDFLKDYFSDSVNFEISRDLKKDKFNLLIENFNTSDCILIKRFYEKGYRFGVVLTEHISKDKDSKTLLLNHQPWFQNRDYIQNLYDRFLNLVIIMPFMETVITLAGQPNGVELKKVFPHIFLNELSEISINLKPPKINQKKFHFCFFGYPTPFRKKIINNIKKKFSIYSTYGVPKEKREEIFLKSNFNLNIPQSEFWISNSPMRTFAASRFKLWTVNIFTNKMKKFNSNKNELNWNIESEEFHSILDNFQHYSDKIEKIRLENNKNFLAWFFK